MCIYLLDRVCLCVLHVHAFAHVCMCMCHMHICAHVHEQ